MRLIFLLFVSFLAFAQGVISQSRPLETWYESSGYLETPRYEQTIAYCKLLAETSSMIQYQSIGISPLGREIPLLIMSKNKRFTAADAAKSGNTVVLIQACIHAGEPDGKDAGFLIMRDIVLGKLKPDIIDNLTILFIPIFNVDGHERFGAYNRINQNGPREMGWRTNAQNLNLNRDYLKADAPETRAWLSLFNLWNPHFFIDIHVTDGADYQYPLTYSLEIGGNMNKALTDWQLRSFVPAMEANMESMKTPVFHYVSFRRWHDPRSGIAARIAPPMLSQGYTALRNRPGLLVETHMFKDYKTRVEATYNLLLFAMGYLSENGKILQNLIKKADQSCNDGSLTQSDFPLKYELSSDSTIIQFKGFEYSMEISDLTGGEWFKYSNTPSEFSVPFFNKNIPTVFAKLPIAYIIPPQNIEIIERIKIHGIRYTVCKKDTLIPANYYFINNPVWASSSYEGRIRLNRFSVVDTLLYRVVLKGSLIITVNQPLGRVVANILEPEAPDSYLSWGFFNSIFEQKEYAENYVMEKMAREMLSDNTQLQQEFEKLKTTNPDIAKNQWALLNWFYRKTKWWDENLNLYPVGRVYSPIAID